MGFNYGLEKRKFTEEWKKLYREYKAAGMSEEDIQDIYAFDLNVFRKNRTEFQRTQPLSESSCDDGIEQGESMSALLKKFSSALSVCDKYSFQSDPRFAWVDEMKQLKRVKANSVIHYHAVIHRALKYAVKIDLISVNPADKVERPKADKFIGSFYDSNEVQALFEAAKGTLIEIPIFLGAFYGLRRSEALGLKWDAIDFQNNTITIRHTVTSCNLDGKHIQIAQDTTKTKSSMRTLPLVPAFKEKLLKLKEQQEEYRRVCGRCYNKKYLEYICVDEMGTLISPHYLTSSFPKLLEKNNLRHIRFHDLRHSCASLLLANGVPMKQIQEWLGHSDFSTTANVYAHLDYNSKLSSADAMVNGLSGALEAIS